MAELGAKPAFHPAQAIRARRRYRTAQPEPSVRPDGPRSRSASESDQRWNRNQPPGKSCTGFLRSRPAIWNSGSRPMSDATSTRAGYSSLNLGFSIDLTQGTAAPSLASLRRDRLSWFSGMRLTSTTNSACFRSALNCTSRSVPPARTRALSPARQQLHGLSVSSKAWHNQTTSFAILLANLKNNMILTFLRSAVWTFRAASCRESGASRVDGALPEGCRPVPLGTGQVAFAHPALQPAFRPTVRRLYSP